MRLKIYLFAMLFMACFCTSWVNADTITVFNGNANPRALANFTIGFDFQVGANDITIDGLGVYDFGLDGLAASHQVGIWDVGGTLLDSVTVPASGGVLEGAFRYIDIPELVLTSGSTYTIGASDFGVDPFNDTAHAGGNGLTAFVDGPGVTRTLNTHNGGAGFTKPTVNGTGVLGRWSGGNARIASTGPPTINYNRSFETDPPHPVAGPTGWVANNFDLPGNNRITFTESAAGLGTSLPYPDGNQAIAFRHGTGPAHSIQQDLDDLGPIEEGEYSVSFFVADRNVSQWLNYRVELVAVDGSNNETVLIDENSVANATIRPVNGSTSEPSPHSGIEGDWLNVVLSADADASLIGQTLRVRFSSTDHSAGDIGNNNDFALDHVTFGFEAVPEPSSILLIGFGIGLLFLKKRFHRIRK